MRIISGYFKGKKISIPNDKNTRPLRDLVKESIFNLLDHSNKFNFQMLRSNVLDLFSGSGSFGLECISRGSSNVTFVENYANVLKILNKNIFNLKAEKNCQIIEKNCFDYLKSISISSDKYDLIFMDPPFKETEINQMIKIIKEKKMLKKDGILIIHRHKKDDIEIKKNINIFEERNYGISKIIIGS